jgi:hypothetical protein
MKTSIALAYLLILLFAVCGHAQGNGAVKINFDPDVGWAVINTTASGKLNATVHLDNGRPNVDFSISVRVRYEDNSVEAFTNIATLSTNGQGKGNVQVKVDLNPSAGDTTLRRVAIRVRRPGPPNILYTVVAWDLPLK